MAHAAAPDMCRCGGSPRSASLDDRHGLLPPTPPRAVPAHGIAFGWPSSMTPWYCHAATRLSLRSHPARARLKHRRGQQCPRRPRGRPIVPTPKRETPRRLLESPSARRYSSGWPSARERLSVPGPRRRPHRLCRLGATDEHRCYAFGDPAPLSDEQQTRVCLQRGYGNCPALPAGHPGHPDRRARGAAAPESSGTPAAGTGRAPGPAAACRAVADPPAASPGGWRRRRRVAAVGRWASAGVAFVSPTPTGTPAVTPVAHANRRCRGDRDPGSDADRRRRLRLLRGRRQQGRLSALRGRRGRAGGQRPGCDLRPELARHRGGGRRVERQASLALRGGGLQGPVVRLSRLRQIRRAQGLPAPGWHPQLKRAPPESL